MTGTDTMPQGAAASPDRRVLAVVASGFNPATLRLYSADTLEQTASIPLPDAFGHPLWIDAEHVLVAGASSDAVLDVDVARRSVASIPMPAHSYPSAVAASNGRYAIATDGDRSVRIGPLDRLRNATPVKIGGYIGGLAFSSDGTTLFASNRSAGDVVAIDARTLAARRIATALHPSALLVRGDELYVAESDADSVGIYGVSNGRLKSRVFVGSGPMKSGASPNALSTDGDRIFVSLGGANSIAVLRDHRLIGRIPAGWYPTDAIPIGNRLFIIDGKGEGTIANPYFIQGDNPTTNHYVATNEGGSIRTYDLTRDGIGGGSPQGPIGTPSVRSDPVVRANGPIRHVFFVLKENRTYDQILGDVPLGNGDAKLAWFGAKVTPNAHALAARYGLFDNTYTDGEVSEAGHDWSDAAFVTDYVQRSWPATYGNRNNDDNTTSALRAMIPRNGYIWQAAAAAGVTVRVYGEQTNVPDIAIPQLGSRYDKKYVSFDLNYSDVNRVKEWRREFEGFVRDGTLPQFEFLWLPNDHTAFAKPGMLTPVACVAQNDYAVGLIVDTISHSPVWKSSAIFVIEDDSQDGPDHVSDQRTAFLLASPYARGGLQHAHYSTTGVLHTIELLLGIPPLSLYDSTAVPLDAAFSPAANLQPYDAIAPKVSITARNGKLAYGARASERLNLRRPDANSPAVANDILAHNLSQ